MLKKTILVHKSFYFKKCRNLVQDGNLIVKKIILVHNRFYFKKDLNLVQNGNLTAKKMNNFSTQQLLF